MPRWGCLLRDEHFKEMGYDLSQEFALFLPLILDVIGTYWLSETGSDLPARCKLAVLDGRGRENHGEQV
jgi:hypothetical protein